MGEIKMMKAYFASGVWICSMYKKTMINCMKSIVEQSRTQLYVLETNAQQKSKNACLQEFFYQYNLFVICLRLLVNLK